jgi:hypothetical protein
MAELVWRLAAGGAVRGSNCGGGEKGVKRDFMGKVCMSSKVVRSEGLG